MESSLDFTFAFNNAKFSDRTLEVEIMPDSKTDPTNIVDWALTRNRKRRCCDQDSNAVQSNENQLTTDDPERRVKNLHINTAILAAKSPFFYKEAAFMDMLKFMYTNTLSSITLPTLLDVLIASDKYEVASCMKYCVRILSNSPMIYESAVMYLDLPSAILMDNTVRPLTDAAKEFLVARFKDISKFHKEIVNLPLAGFEAILSSDDLEVRSEDKIYDFVMNWAQRNYTKQSERQEILNMRLLRLIRFQYMSCDKLKELLSCADINPKCLSELLFEALSFQMSLASHKKERSYQLRPVNVIRFKSPYEECVVYLDLKREECERILPGGKIFSRDFYFGGKPFFLMGKRDTNNQSSSDHSFGLFLGTREGGSVVEYEFSARVKPGKEFVDFENTIDHTFTGKYARGYHNLFGVTWDKFIAEDSLYFINGVLHLRAVISLNT